jgi:hypothetical protein
MIGAILRRRDDAARTFCRQNRENPNDCRELNSEMKILGEIQQASQCFLPTTRRMVCVWNHCFRHAVSVDLRPASPSDLPFVRREVGFRRPRSIAHV